MKTLSFFESSTPRRGSLIALAAVAALCVLPTRPALAAPQEIIFAISAATGSLQQTTSAEFARRAN